MTRRLLSILAALLFVCCGCTDTGKSRANDDPAAEQREWAMGTSRLYPESLADVPKAPV